MAIFKEKITLVYDKTSGRFNDKSAEITSLRTEANYVFITYKNSDREYRYNSENAFTLHLRETIDPVNYDIYIDHELQSDVTAIGYYGSYYAILSTGCYTPRYIAGPRLMLKSNTAKSILAYLREIAEYIDREQPKGDEPGQKFSLSSQFRKIIHAKDNVLSVYLNKIPIKPRTPPETLIYPFDVNTSQKEAVKKH